MLVFVHRVLNEGGKHTGGGRLLAPAVRPEAAALREQGISLTPGSAFGGRIQQVEQAAESIPIVGGIVSGARERQFSEFNVASYNKVLNNLDPKLKVPQGLTGRDAYLFVEKSIKDKYNDVVPDLAVKFTPKVQSGFDAIKNRYAKGNLSEADKQQFQNYVNALESDFRASGVVSGQKAQAIKQDLSEMSRTYGAGTGSTKILGDAFKELEGFYMNTNYYQGYYRILHENNTEVKVKELTVNPGQSLSMQKHHHWRKWFEHFQ